MMQKLYYSLFLLFALVLYGQSSEAKVLKLLELNRLTYSSTLDSIKINGKITKPARQCH